MINLKTAKALGLTTQRCGCEPGEPAGYLDLPYTLERLDERHGPHVFLPVHRNYKPLGNDYHETYGNREDYADQAWYFRRDPSEIEDAWSPGRGYQHYIYTSRDYTRSEKPFLNEYRRRLRLILAEAVPGVGGLSLEPPW